MRLITMLLWRWVQHSPVYEEMFRIFFSHVQYDEGELYGHFKEFYEDVLPEFSRIGKVVQFKVTKTFETHTHKQSAG